MSKKYIKNEKGIVRAVTSDNLQLEKPLLNENYDIEVHNRNMDKIDGAIQEVKGKIDGLELIASNVKMNDGTSVEDAVSTNKESILSNTELVSQALAKADQAFQRGDNVKTQLVDKLISEGLNVSTNNTFEELISGIALGKKWASGVGVESSNGQIFTYLDGSTVGRAYVDLVIDFTPSIIVMSYRRNASECLTVLNNIGTMGTANNVKCSIYNYSNYSNSSFNFKNDANITLGNNTYRLPLTISSVTDITWVAFE